ncbi:dihydropteroate synthase [Tessaracoccus caeni]|uniref:dihydropteroate synthase n=1 Tax=Tessaracoccus caeni TaxID=3031239 RepID=UPI0023DBBF17|nr:dihydropteroate synthase [Tessaracoccus caeni]MDF1487371.1 dihydropteroate synthase [Tessaracoccus caeni]
MSALLLGGRRFDDASPAVMGILNRNRDSFYSPARLLDDEPAFARVEQMIAEGVDVLDVGGVRAGQEGEWVEADEEIRRVAPFVAAVRERFPELLISVDTWRAEVARACDGAVDLVNDTWQGADPALVEAAAELGAGYVVSHTGGLPPRTDPQKVSYPPEPDGVVVDVLRVLRAGAERAVAAGVAPTSVLLDPTLDFGKTTAHSLRLVRATADVVALGYPVMQAISRKDFVGETLGVEIDDRLEGTLAATAVAAWQGAVLFRAHDVLATRRTLDMVASIKGRRPPLRAVRGL